MQSRLSPNIWNNAHLAVGKDPISYDPDSLAFIVGWKGGGMSTELGVDDIRDLRDALTEWLQTHEGELP